MKVSDESAGHFSVLRGLLRPCVSPSLKFAELELEATYTRLLRRLSLAHEAPILTQTHGLRIHNGYHLNKVLDLLRPLAERLESVKPKTVINELVPIKEMFRHAVRWGYIKVSPAEYVEKPRVEKEEMDILTPAEIEAFLDNAPAKDRPLFLTAILTGLRRGELFGLQRGDINWITNQIHVRRSLWKGKFQTPKSKLSVRKVDMTPYLATELKKHILASPNSELDLVFCNTEGNPIEPDTFIKRKFLPALRRAKIRKVRFHDLRHTNVALRIEQEQNIKYIQRQLGHASIQTTLDRYGHLIKDVRKTGKET
jgi:integrase